MARLLLLLALACAAAAAPLPRAPSPPRGTMSNVISPAHTPDPFVTFWNGSYYGVRSKIEASPVNRDPPGWYCWDGAQDQIIVTRARRLEDVFAAPDAAAAVVDRSSPMGGGWGGVSVGAFAVSYRPGDGCPSPGFWAPSLKRIDGRWFIFATGHRPDVAGEANFILEQTGAAGDPLDVDGWVYRGMVDHALPGLDGEPIVLPTSDPLAAAVTLEDNGRTVEGSLYFVYSKNVPCLFPTCQRLHLARLAPDAGTFTEYDADHGLNLTFQRRWRVAGEGAISAPMLNWEEQRFSVNEGPTALYGPRGATALLYSASFCATKYYALGLLAYAGPGNGFPFAWTKLPRPVFSGDVFSEGGALQEGVRPGAFGVGHNSLTVSPDLSQQWIVYHAKTRQEDSPYDREARAQAFAWAPDGRPDFGDPLDRGTGVERPSDAPAYAVFCEEPGFKGFCVGLPPGRHPAAALVRRGVHPAAVASVRLVGGAGVEYYASDAQDARPVWGTDADVAEMGAPAPGAIAAVAVTGPAPSPNTQSSTAQS